jgi:predicted dehydrogenase
MRTSLSRRSFLELTAGLSGGLLAGAASAKGRARSRGRLRHASIGVGGMGVTDLDRIRAHPEVEIVALCDVDQNKLKEAAAKVSGARLYGDWRELLEKEASNIDSVNVTTPDHMHAAITVQALRRKKHVYCQKPLTRTIAEARLVAREAKAAGTVTQMGIQNHSLAPYAAALALFRAGHIGKVREVHVWTDRPIGWWPQGIERPEGADEVPATLAWDLWLGVAPERPYKKDVYHPMKWRGFKDFGTGAQGDMACHLMDPAIWFLELGDPLRIRSEGPAPNAETYPLWSEVRYEFPPSTHTTRGPLVLTWHDGKKKAPREILDSLGAGEVWDNGALFLGEAGAMLTSPYDPPRLLPEERFVEVSIPAAEDRDHWHQWVDACLGKGEVSAPFEYAAHLSEIALLGNVALHFPHETLEWDATAMRFPGRGEADRLLGFVPRKGWEIPGLS